MWFYFFSLSYFHPIFIVFRRLLTFATHRHFYVFVMIAYHWPAGRSSSGNDIAVSTGGL